MYVAGLSYLLSGNCIAAGLSYLLSGNCIAAGLSYLLSGNCIAALLTGRILNSIVLDDGITNAAERETTALQMPPNERRRHYKCRRT